MVAAAGPTQASRDENSFAWQSWAASLVRASLEVTGTNGALGIAASRSLIEGLADMMELRLSCLNNASLPDMAGFLVDEDDDFQAIGQVCRESEKKVHSNMVILVKRSLFAARFNCLFICGMRLLPGKKSTVADLLIIFSPLQ